MFQTRLSFALLSSLMILASGCAVEDGNDGASGEDGAPGARGAAGENGRNGDDGEPGRNGAAGANGAAALVATSTEPPGPNCAAGGTRIDTGIDLDGDGVLDEGEKEAPRFVCNGADGTAGPSQRFRTRRELAGASCAFGGVAVEVGVDIDGDGVLEDDEVEAAATTYVCNTSPAWSELPALPSVATAYSFSVAVNDIDGSARLGFMFGDPAYRSELTAQGVLWEGGGAYSGANVFAVYALEGTGVHATWRADHGRSTPQHYSFSELAFDRGVSYYTTNYTSFGGLVAVVKNGQKGTYALTPAFSGRRAHAIAFVDHALYALIAQKTPGLTLSAHPDVEFGEYPNRWSNLAVLETTASGVSSPELVDAGGTLVGAYVLGGRASIRATSIAASVSEAADFPEIGSCPDAARVDLAWAGGKVHVACIDSNGTLTLRRAELGDLGAVTWEDVPTAIHGPVTELDLSARGSRLGLAVREGDAVRVYADVTDDEPSFDAVLPGSFDLQLAADGDVLAVCDLTGDKTVRTFLH